METDFFGLFLEKHIMENFSIAIHILLIISISINLLSVNCVPGDILDAL